MPLYHFATDNLPNTTKAPELDDTNAMAALKADAECTGQDVSAAAAGSAVTEELVGKYLSYLVATGFLAPPGRGDGKALPAFEMVGGQKEALGGVGGRGGLA